MSSLEMAKLIISDCYKKGIKGHVRVSKHMPGYFAQLDSVTVFIKEDGYLVKVNCRNSCDNSSNIHSEVMNTIIDVLESTNSDRIIVKETINKDGLIEDVNLSVQSKIVNLALLKMYTSVNFNILKNITSKKLLAPRLTYCSNKKAVLLYCNGEVIYSATNIDELQSMESSLNSDINIISVLLDISKPSGVMLSDVNGKFTLMKRKSKEEPFDLKDSVSISIYYRRKVMYLRFTKCDGSYSDICCKDTAGIKYYISNKM